MIFIALFGGVIYILHLFNLVTASNEVYARFIALGIFIAGFGFLGWQKARHHRFSWDDIYKNNTLIIVTLTVLLVSLFLVKRVSYYAIGILVIASLMHFFYTRKFYTLPKFFYFILAYGLLLFFGTIGTERGFHFPDSILSFFVLPLAFCCFCLPKKTLLKIAGIFFKTGIIFLSVTTLYWFYNFLHLDANFIGWITEKTGYFAQMTGWEIQAATHNPLWENTFTKDSIEFYAAYFFVSSWSYLHHPTTNSIVILSGLITGFYLYHKKNEFPTITKYDLLLYIVLSLCVIILLQSRFGIVGFFLIIGITGLYYLKLKTKHFKAGLTICLLVGGASLLMFNDKISDFASDDVRDAYRRIAVSYIQENFWWGSGFGEQRLVLEQQARKMKDVLPPSVYPHSLNAITHVHNQFLGNMVKFGIWGLIMLIAMLTAIAYYAIKNRSYLLQTFLCFILFFMLIEEGEFIIILIFITFFTAICEAKKLKI